MKYYSEITKKLYNTEKDLTFAEAEAKALEAKKIEEQKKKEAAEQAKKAERATRAKEVEKALKELNEAQANALKLLKQFTKDYGYFHMSLSPTKENEVLKEDTFTNTAEFADDFLNLLNSFLK